MTRVGTQYYLCRHLKIVCTFKTLIIFPCPYIAISFVIILCVDNTFAGRLWGFLELQNKYLTTSDKYSNHNIAFISNAADLLVPEKSARIGWQIYRKLTTSSGRGVVWLRYSSIIYINCTHKKWTPYCYAIQYRTQSRAIIIIRCILYTITFYVYALIKYSNNAAANSQSIDNLCGVII